MSKMDIAKSIHQRLLNVRDKTGEPFNNLLVRYGLERLFTVSLFLSMPKKWFLLIFPPCRVADQFSRDGVKTIVFKI